MRLARAIQPEPALPCVAISALLCRLHRSFRGGLHLFRRMKTGGRPQSNPSEDLGRNAPRECRVKIDGIPKILRTDPPLTTPPQTAKRSQHPHGPIGSRHRPLAETAGSPLAMSPASQMKPERPPFARSRYTGITGSKVSPTGRGPSSSHRERPSAPAWPKHAKTGWTTGNGRSESPFSRVFRQIFPDFSAASDR